ncbi:hypothetical protein OROGR_005509 [Orobanche gracilis]
MKIIEIGGAQELVTMLAAAKDDRTRKEALKALIAISKSVMMLSVLYTKLEQYLSSGPPQIPPSIVKLRNTG